MYLLIVYVLIALVFSFLCSIAEAVILSVTQSYIGVLEREKKPSGPLLRKLKKDVGKTLSAILTLNTIAHTVGAVGAGAQAAVVFGSAYLGVASAVLTLLILIFSEIIPKTLGAHHWRRLAPATAYGLRFLVWILYPFVILAEKLTGGVADSATLIGFSRREFEVMADLSEKEGQLAARESEILKNLMRLRKIQVLDVLTPRTVLFSLPENTSVGAFFEEHGDVSFSRIPVFDADPDLVVGFVLRSDILLAHARGETEHLLGAYRRELPALLETTSLAQAFNLIKSMDAHIALVVDEYGELQGILTLEDIMETLLGLEIVDEGDETVDMQALARDRWKKKAEKMGLDFDE